MDNNSPLKLTATIPALGGNNWQVFVSTGKTAPAEYICWDRPSSSPWKTEAQVLGYLKRLARNNGGNARWLILDEGTIYLGRPVVSLWVS